MTRKNRTFRTPPLLWAVLLAWGVLAQPLWAADPEPGEAAQDEAPATQAEPERQDSVFGTMDENIRMDRDPQTGDSIMRVSPKPRPKPQYGLPPVTVEPRVQVPAHGGQHGHGRPD